MGKEFFAKCLVILITSLFLCLIGLILNYLKKKGTITIEDNPVHPSISKTVREVIIIGLIVMGIIFAGALIAMGISFLAS